MAAWQAGFNAKVRINFLPYVASSYRARETATDQDVSNTEGIVGNQSLPDFVGGIAAPDQESRMAGIAHMEAEVRNPTFDLTRNPFAVPVGVPNVYSGGAAVSAGNFIDLEILVAGVGGPAWTSASFLVLEASQDMDIQRLQPVSFSGRSDGLYSTPFSV